MFTVDLIKTEILSLLYSIKNLLLFDTLFDHERVEKANLQIILFVGQHVINGRLINQNGCMYIRSDFLLYFV